MGENLQFAELELLLHWENYASTEGERKDATETQTSVRVGGLNLRREREEQQGEDPPPHPSRANSPSA